MSERIHVLAAALACGVLDHLSRRKARESRTAILLAAGAWFFCAVMLVLFVVSTPGCAPTSPVESITIPVDAGAPSYWFPAAYSDTGTVIGANLDARPMMVRWPGKVDNLVGFTFGVYCQATFPQPPLPPGSRPYHLLRATFRGSPIPAPFDSLRGTLAPRETGGFYVDLVDDPANAVPVPDSIGIVSGGTYALAQDADTLSGIVNVRFGSATCKCATPVYERLIRAPGSP